MLGLGFVVAAASAYSAHQQARAPRPPLFRPVELNNPQTLMAWQRRFEREVAPKTITVAHANCPPEKPSMWPPWGQNWRNHRERKRRKRAGELE